MSWGWTARTVSWLLLLGSLLPCLAGLQNKNPSIDRYRPVLDRELGPWPSGRWSPPLRRDGLVCRLGRGVPPLPVLFVISVERTLRPIALLEESIRSSLMLMTASNACMQTCLIAPMYVLPAGYAGRSSMTRPPDMEVGRYLRWWPNFPVGLRDRERIRSLD